MLFKIDGIDCSAYVVHKSYDIQQKNEYGGTEYTDGWWTKHRTVVRTRISGKVTLAMNPTAYNNFLLMFKAMETANGFHQIDGYILNINENKTFNAFVDASAKAAITTHEYNDTAVFFNVTLNIEEK